MTDKTRFKPSAIKAFEEKLLASLKAKKIKVEKIEYIREHIGLVPCIAINLICDGYRIIHDNGSIHGYCKFKDKIPKSNELHKCKGQMVTTDIIKIYTDKESEYIASIEADFYGGVIQDWNFYYKKVADRQEAIS